MATEVQKRGGGEWWGCGDVAAVREMAKEIYDTAVLSEKVIGRIEAHQEQFRLGRRIKPEYDKDLFHLKLQFVDFSIRIFRLADPKTKKKIREFQPGWMGKSEGSSLVSKPEPVFEVQTARPIHHNLKQTYRKNKGTLEESMESMDFESEPMDIGDGGKSISTQELQDGKQQSMKLLLANIYKSSVAKSSRSKEEAVVSHRGSFKLDLISSVFDELWDEIHQIVSTKLQFLATSMLTPLAGHISALRLISADIEWLCTWVPVFAQKLQCINADEEIEEEMEDGDKIEEAMFASYISCWEQTRSGGYCCRFEDPTILSSMLFTHYRPGQAPFFSGAARTMQIFSVKVTILEGFKWPLEVYGVVAARDAVDYRRNDLFVRTRDDCQSLNGHECFLHLTGPSRAVMSNDTVMIEVQLKVKGRTESEDRGLISRAVSCNGGHSDGFLTRSISGYFCRIDILSEHLGQSIQATVLGVRVKKGSLPSKNGLQVACAALPEEELENKAERTSRQVVLVDQKVGRIPMDEEGYLDLSRQVVSVKLEGRLEVLIKTSSESGDISGVAVFTPQLSNIISKEKCVLGECEFEVIVAWSGLVDDHQSLLMMSYQEPCTSAPLRFMKLNEDA